MQTNSRWCDHRGARQSSRPANRSPCDVPVTSLTTTSENCFDTRIPLVAGVSLELEGCFDISTLTVSATVKLCVLLGCSTLIDCDVGTGGQKCCFGRSGLFKACLAIEGRCLQLQLDVLGDNRSVNIICV